MMRRCADGAACGGAAVQSQPLWLQVPEVLLVADIGFYLAHRAFHAVPFLWKFHSMHHSIEEMDWLAAYRVHPLDQILTKSASFLPVYALGFSDSAILLFVLIYKWQSVAIHSNSRIGLGPLKWLFASPQFHHWHHAKEPAAMTRISPDNWFSWTGWAAHCSCPAACPTAMAPTNRCRSAMTGRSSILCELPDPLCLRPHRPGNEAAGRLGASRAMAEPTPLPLLALLSI